MKPRRYLSKTLKKASLFRSSKTKQLNAGAATGGVLWKKCS